MELPIQQKQKLILTSLVTDDQVRWVDRVSMNAKMHKSINEQQPTTQMDTNIQCDGAAKGRRAKTEWEEQNEIVHHPGDGLVRIDESNRFRFKIELKTFNIFPTRRPIDTREESDEPERRAVHRESRRENDEDRGHCHGGEDLEGDGVHVDGDVWNEKGGATLVTVEEGGSDLQHIHESWNILEAYWATLWSYGKYLTRLIRVGGGDLIRRYE
jgi:hypothetical protein